MTAAVENDSDPLLLECAAFTFKCVDCNAEQKFNVQGVNDLTKGQCVNCAVCKVKLQVHANDKERMAKYLDHQTLFGKSMLVFCLLWFSANALVLFLYGSLEAGLMSCAGVFIFMGIKFSMPEELETLDLEPAGGD